MDRSADFAHELGPLALGRVAALADVFHALRPALDPPGPFMRPTADQPHAVSPPSTGLDESRWSLLWSEPGGALAQQVLSQVAHGSRRMFDVLSRPEQAIVVDLLRRRYPRRRRPPYLGLLWELDYRIRPPTIDEFVRDPRLWADLGHGPSPAMRQHLHRIFDPTHPACRVAFTGAPGTGKTTAGLVAQLFVLCRLLCLREPQEYYGLMAGSAIEIGLFSVTLMQARALLERFASAARASPFCPPFVQTRLSPFSRGARSAMRFEDHTVQVVTGSRVFHGLGQSFLGTLIDIPPGRPRGVPATAPTELFAEQRSRIPSRFPPGGGTPPGLLVVCVSRDYGAAFAPHLRKMEGQAGCYVASLP